MGGPEPSLHRESTDSLIAGPLTGQKHPLLMVVGGWVGGALGDVWLLDVDRKMWVCISDG